MTAMSTAATKGNGLKMAARPSADKFGKTSDKLLYEAEVGPLLSESKKAHTVDTLSTCAISDPASGSCDDELLDDVELHVLDARKIVGYCSQLKYLDGSTEGPSELLVSGWLSKRRSQCCWASGWGRYYCELYPDLLVYFKDEAATKRKGQIEIYVASRAVGLDMDTVEYLSQRPYGFVLDPEPANGKGRSLFYFDAANKEEFTMWTRAIDWKNMQVAADSFGVLNSLEIEDKETLSGRELAQLLKEVDPETWTQHNVCLLLDTLKCHRKKQLKESIAFDAFEEVINICLDKSKEKGQTLSRFLSCTTIDELRLTLPHRPTVHRHTSVRTVHEIDEDAVEDEFWRARRSRLLEKGCLTFVLLQAWNVPTKDLFSGSDPYVLIEVHIKDRGLVARGHSMVIHNSAEPIWNQRIDIPSLEGEHAGRQDLPPAEWDPHLTLVKLRLYDKDFFIRDEFIGECILPLMDVLDRKVSKVILWDKQGNPVLSSQRPFNPCMLSFHVDSNTRPSSWPVPALFPDYTAEDYPYHVFMITRGTRGDVQPFVALARGMAEQCGWLVTICTEVRWKEFVKSNAQVSRGRVRFRPSGGDTFSRVECNMWAVQAKTEVIQMAILASCEAEFFCSTSVFLTHILEMEREPKPVDLLLCGLTTAGVGLLLNDLCSKQLSLFILQPSVIPSQDEQWAAIEAIKTHTLPLIDTLEQHFFTSHKSLQALKGVAEENPFASFTIDGLRTRFGLKPKKTWQSIQKEQVPVIIPMMKDTFERPSDWSKNVVMTDFIFLRKPQAPNGARAHTLGGRVDKFIHDAREASGMIGLMTFSSMAVSRRKILECCIKMVEQCQFGLHMIYVGQEHGDCPASLVKKADELTAKGRFLSLSSADFGVLFKEVDCFIIHGGLGTTVEALRMKKPCTVTGPLLLDQRFWGKLVFEKGLGTEMAHIDQFHESCVEFVDNALDPRDPRGWQNNARNYDWGDGEDDGVKTNVDFFRKVFERKAQNGHISGISGERRPEPTKFLNIGTRGFE